MVNRTEQVSKISYGASFSTSSLAGASLGTCQRPAPLCLIESRNTYTIGEILRIANAPRCVVCDFRVQAVEEGALKPWGFEKDGVFAVDHHMPAQEMERPVSSTNLALQYVSANGPVPEEVPVLINHTDCDSILSSAIMRGVLPPLNLFGDAALKADQFGVTYVNHEIDGHPVFVPASLADHIADFLQAQDFRRPRCPQFALRNLRCLMENQPLEQEAKDWLVKRHAKLKAAHRTIMNGGVRWLGRLAWVNLESPIDSEFFPSLLPQAGLILVTARHRDGNGFNEFKLRLGQGATPGFSLHNLKVHEVDAGYGGRWNAGANTRGGGTRLAPEAIAQAVLERFIAEDRKLQQFKDSVP